MIEPCVADGFMWGSNGPVAVKFVGFLSHPRLVPEVGEHDCQITVHRAT